MPKDDSFAKMIDPICFKVFLQFGPKKSRPGRKKYLDRACTMYNVHTSIEEPGSKRQKWTLNCALLKKFKCRNGIQSLSRWRCTHFSFYSLPVTPEGGSWKLLQSSNFSVALTKIYQLVVNKLLFFSVFFPEKSKDIMQKCNNACSPFIFFLCLFFLINK